MTSRWTRLSTSVAALAAVALAAPAVRRGMVPPTVTDRTAPQSPAARPAYSITYYGLRLRFEPEHHSVRGDVVIGMRGPNRIAARGPAPLTLDLDTTMTIDSVVVAGTRVAETRQGQAVIVPMAIAAGDLRLVDVYYHGTPAGDALVFGRHGDAPVISSYGLPYSARSWWPSIDAPRAKADSADIEITAPSALVAASNGRLVARRENADGTATTQWSVRYPIYPDVIAVAVSNYALLTLAYRSPGGDSLPMPFYVFPEDLEKARVDFAVLPAMLAHHVARFGPYPFMREKYGVVEMAQESFREHQTLPGYGSHLITGDHTNDWILAHELAHQWFGDALTVRNWSHAWLNEGFATYAALLWREQSVGKADYLAAARRQMVPETYNGVLYVADSANVAQMFTRVTFQKGALVLHMLRHVMGDSAFFRALHSYVAGNLYRTVTTADFERAAETSYRRPLDWFFREWVYRGGAPEYSVSGLSVTPSRSGYRVAFDVRQCQDSGVFRMPLDVALTTRSGVVVRVAWDSARAQHMAFDTPDSVTAVALDPDGWVVTANAHAH